MRFRRSLGAFLAVLTALPFATGTLGCSSAGDRASTTESALDDPGYSTTYIDETTGRGARIIFSPTGSGPTTMQILDAQGAVEQTQLLDALGTSGLSVTKSGAAQSIIADATTGTSWSLDVTSARSDGSLITGNVTGAGGPATIRSTLTQEQIDALSHGGTQPASAGSIHPELIWFVVALIVAGAIACDAKATSCANAAATNEAACNGTSTWHCSGLCYGTLVGGCTPAPPPPPIPAAPGPYYQVN